MWTTPKVCPVWLVFLLGTCLATLVQADLDAGGKSENNCDLYLAESSIPDAGWGVFTARDYRRGDRIGTPTIGIPVFDKSRSPNATEYGALKEYLWGSNEIGGFSDALTVDLFLPGAASLVNHHSALDNVIPGGLTLDGNLLRDVNPMAGSFTAYHRFRLIAKRDIQAGEELFADKTRNSQHQWAPLLSKLPTAEQYERADEIVRELYHNTHMDLTDAQWTDVLYRIQHELMGSSTSSTLKNTAQQRNSVLPETLDEVKRVLQVGSARLHLADRDLAWIQTNGKCMDTIREGKSSVEEAGRGAFATRAMAKDSVVSTAPLVQVTNYTAAMKMNTFNNTIVNNATQQLLLNYCFGHDKSELLLCPTTQAVLMNHDSKKANVAIRWAKPNKQGTKDYRTSTVDDLKVDQADLTSHNTRLMFEYVALQDIQAGDELFLDYGPAWEAELNNHMEHGFSTLEERHVPAKVCNEENRVITNETIIGYGYECLVYPNIEIDTGGPTGSVAWEEFSSNRAIDQHNWPGKFKAWYKDNDFAAWYPCGIVEADNTKMLYKIEMWVKPIGIRRVGRKFLNVPRHRIRFTEGLYYSDQNLPWAFRQYIPIPDSIFPLRWRNDYRTAASWNLGTIGTIQQTTALANEYEQNLREVECGMYLAESNIPNAGFGTYTAVDIPAGGLMVTSTLPVVPANMAQMKKHWPGEDYVWSGSAFNTDLESWPNLDTSMLALLFGSLANAHTGITNMFQNSGTWNPILDRSVDPGAGAFSDYINYSFRSLYPVAAGEELFVSYGEHWFKQRKQFSEVPLKANFVEANAVLAIVWSLTHLEGAALKKEDTPLLMKFIRETLVDPTSVRTRSALGAVQSFEDLHHVVTRNGTAKATVESRSEDWLEENGYCQDHIFVKRSTIHQAGQGAFSRRFLTKGTSIISAPAIATRREMMHLNITNSTINSKQLLLNYHFGHKDSSIMFIPLNHAIAINHNSKRKWSGQKPNARVQFSTREKRSKYFLSLTLDDLRDEKYSTMVLDFVATRDIQPDEEIFVDYGQAWEDSWDKHVKEWTSPCKGEKGPCFRSSRLVHMMNDQKFIKKYHAWSDTHVSACFFNRTELSEDSAEFYYIVENFPESFEEVIDPRVKLSYESIKYGHEGFGLPRFKQLRTEHELQPCIILGTGDNVFDVVFLFGKQGSSGLSKKLNANSILRVRDLPAKSVEFHLRPSKSDMVAPEGFRHEIAIPDESFPPLWKDMVEQS